jgi:hypothetical protein
MGGPNYVRLGVLAGGIPVHDEKLGSQLGTMAMHPPGQIP